MATTVTLGYSQAVAQTAQPLPPVCFIVQNESFGGMEVHTIGLMRTLIEGGRSIELISNRYRGYDAVIEARGWKDSVRIVHTDMPGILYGQRGSEQAWRSVLAGVRSRVLIFPKGDANYGQSGFLRACRRHFDKVLFVEHLEFRARPTGTRRWLGVIPGLHLWWHKRRFLSRLGARHADCIVAVSSSVRERLVRDLHYPADKVIVVRNGVAWKDHPRDPTRGAAFRAKHSIPADAFVFGMLTRLQAQKGIDIALHALQGLMERNPGRLPYLAVAGEGAQLDELKQLAERLGIRQRVKFVGFVRDPGEVLSGYDVILFSSRNEGLPLALLEGMAAGCIPVVTRISGMPEAVPSDDIGCVVPPEDAQALSAAMERVLLLDTQALTRMRENVVQSIRRNFDIAECHRKILEACGLRPLPGRQD